MSKLIVSMVAVRATQSRQSASCRCVTKLYDVDVELVLEFATIRKTSDRVLLP